MVRGGPEEEAMRAWFTREPWEDHYAVRLAADFERGVYAHATGVDESGHIVFTEKGSPSGQIVEPFLYLRYDVMEAFGKALSQITQSSDQTLDALKDTREVRDRLLVLVEKTVSK